MKKRYLYSLLFGVPGLFVAGGISVLALGALTGMLWLFVLGDNPWPARAEFLLSAVFVVICLILWTGMVIVGYRVGRWLESDPIVNRTHVLLSAGLTILFILGMVVYRWSASTSGLQADTLLCSEFCTGHGYSGSGMPPSESGARICSCFDDSGNEALRIPLDYIRPGRP
jgi:hypothetical protein